MITAKRSATYTDLFDLVQKYNQPGPRYTSYPTAPQFKEDFGPADFRAELERSNTEYGSGGLSLYLHLPFCRSLCYYCGCHMMVTHRPEKIEQYVQYLEREIDLISGFVKPDRRVVQAHWGGGTPTFLSPEQIERLMIRLRMRFAFSPDAEVSIEADPRGLSDAHLEAAYSVGFNRISFGVQDFDPEVQEAINRVQPYELVEHVTRVARQLGFESISYDLIYGLPRQSPKRFERTVDQVLALAPDRISLFSYAHVPWLKKHQLLIKENDLPDPERKLETFLMAMEQLTRVGGYRYIGMDHLARSADSLSRAQEAGTLQRNFQGYSTHAGSELYGLGLSSISQLSNAYVQNELGLPDYYVAIDAGRPATRRGYRMNVDDHLRRHVIMKLMTNFSLDIRDVEKQFEIDFSAYFEKSLSDLRALEEDGLVSITAEAIQVTELGRFFIRNIAMPFDAYLQANGTPRKRIYSQTV